MKIALRNYRNEVSKVDIPDNINHVYKVHTNGLPGPFFYVR